MIFKQPNTLIICFPVNTYLSVALVSQATNTTYISMFTQQIQRLLTVEAGGEEKNTHTPVNTCLLKSYTALPQKCKVKADRKTGRKPH